MNISKTKLIKYLESEQSDLAKAILETGVEQRESDEMRGKNDLIKELIATLASSKLDAPHF